MNTISDFDLGWLVGFYEGEGSCSCYKRGGGGDTLSIKVEFAQKDLEPLLRVRDILGIKGSMPVAGGTHHLMYCATEARAILRLMKPHLSERRQNQIQKALDTWNARPEKGRNRRHGTASSIGQMRLVV